MLPPRLSKSLFCYLLLPDLVLGQISKWTTPPQISCPEGSKIYGSHCYGVFQEPKTWNSAELKCQSLPSGHLLSLMNESEAAFVAALATQSLGEKRSHLWIGLHDPSQNRRWHWSDNAVLTLNAWERGAPAKTTPRFCVSLSPRSGYLQWKDQHCNEGLPFICKFSA